MVRNAVVGAALALALLVGGCATGTSIPSATDGDPSGSAASKASVSIGAVTFVSHPSLDAVYEGIKEGLAEAGYDPVYGARPLKRVIQRNLQDQLAGLLLEGTIKDGDAVRVTASPEGLEVRPYLAAAA